MKSTFHVLGTGPGIQNFLAFEKQINYVPVTIGVTDIARYYPKIENLVIINPPGEVVDSGKGLKLSKNRFTYDRIKAIHRKGCYYSNFYTDDPTLWLKPFYYITNENGNTYDFKDGFQIIHTEKIINLYLDKMPRGLLHNKNKTWGSNNSPFVAAVLAYREYLFFGTEREIVLWGVDLTSHRFLSDPPKQRKAIDDFERLRDVLWEEEGIKLLLGYKGTSGNRNALDGTLDEWERGII